MKYIRGWIAVRGNEESRGNAVAENFLSQKLGGRGKRTTRSSSCVDALFRSIFNFPFYYCEQAFIVELKLNNKNVPRLVKASKKWALNVLFAH